MSSSVAARRCPHAAAAGGPSSRRRRLWHRALAQPAEEASQLLDGVCVVLVAPKTPGNIGAAVRLAANFEVAQLAVVAPRCSLEHEDVQTLARSGPASTAVLANLQVYPDLAAALSDTTGARWRA